MNHLHSRTPENIPIPWPVSCKKSNPTSHKGPLANMSASAIFMLFGKVKAEKEICPTKTLV